jgi:hypothetical protein
MSDYDYDDDVVEVDTVGEDFESGGDFLDAPGFYHFYVVDAETRPKKGNGDLIPSALVQLQCQVLASSVAGQEKKTHRHIVFKAKDVNKTKTQDRSLIALGLLDPSNPQPVKFKASDLVARQFVCQLELDDEGKHLRLAYANIWHPLDPALARHNWISKEWLGRLVPAQQTPPKFARAEAPATTAAPSATGSNVDLSDV